MEIKNYIISITAVAAICGIISTFLSKRTMANSIIKLLMGIVMTLTVVSPITSIEFESLAGYIDQIEAQASSTSEYGIEAANAEISAIIKEQAESYISDKATSMGLELSVAVTMSEENTAQPHSASISGSISPYNKKILSEFIKSDLGIPEERQIWK